MTKTDQQKQIDELHKQADSAKERFYTDPNSGLLVQTEYSHKIRGSCCESGCRHCPYGFNKKLEG